MSLQRARERQPCDFPTPDDWNGSGAPGYCKCGEWLGHHDPQRLADALGIAVSLLGDYREQQLGDFYRLMDPHWQDGMPPPDPHPPDRDTGWRRVTFNESTGACELAPRPS